MDVKTALENPRVIDALRQIDECLATGKEIVFPVNLPLILREEGLAIDNVDAENLADEILDTCL